MVSCIYTCYQLINAYNLHSWMHIKHKTKSSWLPVCAATLYTNQLSTCQSNTLDTLHPKSIFHLSNLIYNYTYQLKQVEW